MTRYLVGLFALASVPLHAQTSTTPVEIYLSEKLQLKHRSPEVRETNAEAYRFFQQGECALAIDAATLSLKVTKKADPLALIVRGTCHFKTQRPDLAIVDYERAARISKEAKAARTEAIPVAYLEQGQQLTEANQPLQARRSFRRALKWNPQSAAAHSELAYLSFLEKQYPDCVKSADRAIALDAKLFRAWVNRGACLSSMGKSEKAIADLSKALELDPKNAEALLNRATSYLLLRDCSQAVRDAEAALAINEQLREPASQILSQCPPPKSETTSP